MFSVIKSKYCGKPPVIYKAQINTLLLSDLAKFLSR